LRRGPARARSAGPAAGRWVSQPLTREAFELATGCRPGPRRARGALRCPTALARVDGVAPLAKAACRGRPRRSSPTAAAGEPTQHERRRYFATSSVMRGQETSPARGRDDGEEHPDALPKERDQPGAYQDVTRRRLVGPVWRTPMSAAAAIGRRWSGQCQPAVGDEVSQADVFPRFNLQPGRPVNSVFLRAPAPFSVRLRPRPGGQSSRGGPPRSCRLADRLPGLEWVPTRRCWPPTLRRRPKTRPPSGLKAAPPRLGRGEPTRAIVCGFPARLAAARPAPPTRLRNHERVKTPSCRPTCGGRPR